MKKNSTILKLKEVYNDEIYSIRVVSHKKIVLIYSMPICVKIDGELVEVDRIKNKATYQISPYYTKVVYQPTGKGNGYLTRKLSHKFGVKMLNLHPIQEKMVKLGEYELSFINTKYLIEGHRGVELMRDFKLKELI